MGTIEWIRLIECVSGYLRTQDVILKRSELLYCFIQNLAGVIIIALFGQCSGLKTNF